MRGRLLILAAAVAALLPVPAFATEGADPGLVRLRHAIAAVEKARHATVSVAVERDGQITTAGSPLQVRAASLIKLLIVDAAIAAGPLSAAERADARAALRDSDNDAATRLWTATGRDAGVARVVARLRLRHTREVAAFLEPWDGWVSTAADQVRVVEDAAARGGTIPALLLGVESAQRWGVDAAAPAGSRPIAKDGWLPQPGGWLAHSVGCFTPRGHRRVCVAVLTAGSPSYAAGTALATTAARAAARAAAQR